MRTLLLACLLLFACKRTIPTRVPVVMPADSFRFTTTICDTLYDTVTHRFDHTTVKLIREPGRLRVQVKRDTIRTTVEAQCPPPPELPWWVKYLPWVTLAAVMFVVFWMGKK